MTTSVAVTTERLPWELVMMKLIISNVAVVRVHAPFFKAATRDVVF